MSKACEKRNIAMIINISLFIFLFVPGLLWADNSRPYSIASQKIGSLQSVALQVAANLPEDTDGNIVPAPVSSSRTAEKMIALEEKKTIGGDESQAVKQKNDSTEETNSEEEAEGPKIADPIKPVNKAMFYFNDKLYFWGIKPVTQVYSHIIPEDFRFAFSNVYDNLWAPSRVINNLLQLRLKAAGNELIRFVFNSFAGIGGMGDVAKEALGIKKQEADFGQTLGHYGIGHGIYLVLPVFGPSSVRDGVGLVADQLMHPITYVPTSYLTFGEKVGIFAHSKVNDTSFKIGEYESFKEASLDPYVSMRDAFVQYREKMVEDSKK